MAIDFSFNKVKKTKTRKLSILPRIGFSVEFAGKRLTYKHVPFLETILNTKRRDFTLKRMGEVSNNQLQEVALNTSTEK